MTDESGARAGASAVREWLSRLRDSRAGSRLRRLRRADDECGMPWTTAQDPWSHDVTEEQPMNDRSVEARIVARARPEAPVTPGPIEPASITPPSIPRAPAPPVAHLTRDEGLVDALHRIADTFETIAENLEIDRRERQAHLDSLEVLLRELIGGLGQPTAVSPIVVGGSIEANPASNPAELEPIDLTDEVPAID